MSVPAPSLDAASKLNGMTLNDAAPPSSQRQGAGLSKRGTEGAEMLNGPIQNFFSIIRDPYDPETNPEGNIIMGVADNGLLRKELLEYFTQRQLKMVPNELTYADRFFTSHRLLESVCRMFNETSDGLPSSPSAIPDKVVNGSRLLTPLRPEHVVTGCGATGVLDAMSWTFCDPGDGVLLSKPYYNAFDMDLTLRSKAQILDVELPDISERSSDGRGLRCFEKDTAQLYEERIQKALKEGVTPKVLLLCNPHNPTGAIYPRETVIELARVAARHNLHFVVDEIYARSCYATRRIPDPVPFTSVLKLDLLQEAGLPKQNLHVVTSASKDFGINGFRLGIFISQHNAQAIAGMTSLSALSQASSPAAVLFGSILDDESFLAWYLRENARRLGKANDYATAWAEHHSIPYVASSSGHFMLLDLRGYISSDAELSNLPPDEAEKALYDRLVAHRVQLGPGAIYHLAQPGWFRLTFSLPSKVVGEGFRRIEKALGWKQTSFVAKVGFPRFEEGGEEMPGQE